MRYLRIDSYCRACFARAPRSWGDVGGCRCVGDMIHHFEEHVKMQYIDIDDVDTVYT